ncbi:MAG: DUF4440 domain-containing protein [Candidatus Dadabacteria bacterium]|nr:DUF4440 domain-containing protein [Candidatus Dadabacteria bacterium]NIQ16479.1 DUF4440 domain-containing protein [Candidatus Dadabacteria bacterium]
MKDDINKQEILKINDLFYKALGTRDLDLMGKIWIKDERSGCVHPGWIVLRSWDAIKQSWENIFDPEDQVDINISNITLDIKKDIAWLTCIQEMVYIKRDPVTFNLSQSTNIFEKDGSNWYMILHHASPIPFDLVKSENQNLQ